MALKSLALATSLLLPPLTTAAADNNYPAFHQMMEQGNLVAGSSLTINDQTVRIASNSKPERGFLLLESLRQVNGKNIYRGFIQQGSDVTLTVLQNNDGSVTKIYQSDKGTEIKTVDGVRKKPLRASEINRESVASVSGWSALAATPSDGALLTPPVVDNLDSVDTLVLFDPRLPARVNSVGRQFETDLQGAINLTETIFENSGLAYRHNLAATHAINLPSTTNRYINSPTEDILDELVQSGEVQRLKDSYDADVVHYIGLTDQV